MLFYHKETYHFLPTAVIFHNRLFFPFLTLFWQFRNDLKCHENFSLAGFISVRQTSYLLIKNLTFICTVQTKYCFHMRLYTRNENEVKHI